MNSTINSKALHVLNFTLLAVLLSGCCALFPNLQRCQPSDCIVEFNNLESRISEIPALTEIVLGVNELPERLTGDSQSIGYTETESGEIDCSQWELDHSSTTKMHFAWQNLRTGQFPGIFDWYIRGYKSTVFQKGPNWDLRGCMVVYGTAREVIATFKIVDQNLVGYWQKLPFSLPLNTLNVVACEDQVAILFPHHTELFRSAYNGLPGRWVVEGGSSLIVKMDTE